MAHVRSPHLLDPARCGLLVVDLQEKLLPAIPSSDAVVRQTGRLLQAAQSLEIPTAATVQYPKGLGPLEASLAQQLPEPEEKMDFSAAVCRGALDHWVRAGRDQVLIAGIETHICVLQTVLDLVAEERHVFVVAEAVAARRELDHELALQRMQAAGAVLTTFETVLFELCRTAQHGSFKAISRMVKEADVL